MKRCSKCGVEKSYTDFYPQYAACKKCHNTMTREYRKAHPEKYRKASKEWYARNRERALINADLYRFTHKEQLRAKKKDYWITEYEHKLEKVYGLTLDQYHALQEKQDFSCAICGKVERLVVDHDHQSGRVRGLLCRGCNTGLGSLGDDPAILTQAVAYLTLHIERAARKAS